MNDDDLVSAAQDARKCAYAPYSRFSVGAAVRTRSGRVFTGGNVENASYGLSVCAERVAVFAAVAACERDIEAIAVATDEGAPPCGACRQVLAEFGPSMRVILVASSGRCQEFTLDELLPKAFTPADLGTR